MGQEKPTLEEYAEWARQALDHNWDKKVETNYDVNSVGILNTVQEHPFFRDIDSILYEIACEYNPASPRQLFTSPPEIRLYLKPFKSVFSKAYRKNVLQNPNFPDPPPYGWITPQNIYTQLNDIVRSMTVCRYADGPEFVASRLVERAKRHGIDAFFERKDNERGYYAYHFYALLDAEIVNMDFTTHVASVSVELQMTTQLQEVLRELTHGFYEAERVNNQGDVSAWKWDFDSPKFQASYLGHTLHLLEAMIVKLKDQVGQSTPAHGTNDEKSEGNGDTADE